MDNFEVYQNFINTIKDDNIIFETFYGNEMICSSHIGQTVRHREHPVFPGEMLPVSSVSLDMNFFMNDRFAARFLDMFPAPQDSEVPDHIHEACLYINRIAFRKACKRRGEDAAKNSWKNYNTFRELESRSSEFYRDAKAVDFVNSNGAFDDAILAVGASVAKDNFFSITACNLRNAAYMKRSGMDSIVTFNINLRLNEFSTVSTDVRKLECTLDDFEQPHLLLSRLTGLDEPPDSHPVMRM